MVLFNTSPLVYLAALGDFEFLRELFGQIAIPSAVYQEIAVGGASLPVAAVVETARHSWLSVHDAIDMPEADRLRQTGLHPGESEAIDWYVRDMDTDDPPQVPVPLSYKPRLAFLRSIDDALSVFQESEYAALESRVSSRFGKEGE